MLLGADPDELERAAARCTALARSLRRARRAPDGLAQARWHGPAATRARSRARHTSVQLGLRAGQLERLGAALATQAAQQRRASLAPPARSVERTSGVGDGRRVVRIGAPDAAVLVVLVPGVGTDLTDAARLERDARTVHTALAVAADRDGVQGIATVSWLGYDPPDHLIGGLARAPADRGAAQLVRDVERWRGHGAERVVVVGHSYGGVVAARAAAAGMAADEVVLLGAPGLGVASADRVALPDGVELWSAAAPDDPIALLARLAWVWGPDPAAVARPLPTEASGHGGYLRDPRLLDALASLALHDPRPAGTVAAPDPRGAPWASPSPPPTASPRS